jgi:NAD(P)-dependent dehydrogenase (short-subunit alcohol dehydrogenase family)
MALAFVEAGARAVYCVDLPTEPSDEWKAVRAYAAQLANKRGEGRLEYVSGNVTDQVRMVQAADSAQAATAEEGES